MVLSCPRWLPRLLLQASLASAAAVHAGPDAVDTSAPRAWLARIHAAATSSNYQGTLVFTTGGVVSSSRLAHYRVGDQAYERIEALDGKQRRVYRHNDTVHTVWPQSGVVVIEKRSPLMALPSATQSIDPRALEQYEMRSEGRERVAGRDAVVMLMQPRDEWRFAQRIWADQETGLMLRTDIVGPGRTVLESSAFSEVEIGVRPQPETVLQPLRRLDGLRVVRPSQSPTQLEAEGWILVRPLPGFRQTAAVRRALAAGRNDPPMPEVLQTVFSDGLTYISLFIEPYDGHRHKQDLTAQFGATHTLSMRRGESWITLVGDVPAATLKLLADALERRRP